MADFIVRKALRAIGGVFDGANRVYSLSNPAPPAPFTPPSGAWQTPSNHSGTATGSPVSGSVYFEPLDVGPNPLTISQLGCSVSTAQSGGAVTYTLGLYKDDGTGGAPLLTTAGLLASGTITAAAGGNRTLVLGSNLTLPPGRYWFAFLMVTTTAPTTAAVFNVLSAVGSFLWMPATSTIGAAVRYLVLAGPVTTLPTAAATLSSSGNSVAPVMAAKVA